MKAKKVIVGAVSAAMLSLSVCSLAPAVAAGETVQISVGKAQAKAGEQFTVDVSLADVPSTGITAIDFQIAFDNSLITIDKVEAGTITNTGADSKDPTVEASNFDSSIYNEEGIVSLVWSTGLDSSYYINKDGVFCTITGTVSKSASDGAVADLKIEPTDRQTKPNSGEAIDQVLCGYLDASGTKVLYSTGLNNGSVTVGNGAVQGGVRGDANCDEQVTISDSVLIMQVCVNRDKYGVTGSAVEERITERGMLNGDVAGGSEDHGGDQLTPKDALRIQEYLLGKADLV